MPVYLYSPKDSVSTHSRPKAAGHQLSCYILNKELFQHTAARRRLGLVDVWCVWGKICFNTQPPEGGWELQRKSASATHSFNTQPPEGGWSDDAIKSAEKSMFQHTAARRRLGLSEKQNARSQKVSTHSRPKAAGLSWLTPLITVLVSTHSRPKAAGRGYLQAAFWQNVSTHSRPKAAGD